MKRCSRCKKAEARKGQRYCRLCTNAYKREHRKKHSMLSPEARFRATCRAYANVYKRRGKLTPQVCEICDEKKVQMHHEDYTKPLMVSWLCVECHTDLHHS